MLESLFNKVAGRRTRFPLKFANFLRTLTVHEKETAKEAWTLSNIYDAVLFAKTVKTCVRYFSLFSKEQYVSGLFRTKYFEKKFNLQLLYLPIVSQTFILPWATTRCPPSSKFLFWKNNCMCNPDNVRDIAACQMNKAWRKGPWTLSLTIVEQNQNQDSDFAWLSY